MNTEKQKELILAAQEMAEILELSDPKGRRAKGIVAPEDPMVKDLCEKIGYGAVMDSAARQWRLKEPVGAHTTGAAAESVRMALETYLNSIKE